MDPINQAGRQFAITMDNYFKLPRVINFLQAMKIGVLGKARQRRGWPPAELRTENIKDISDPIFNQLYWTIYKYGTLICRWMDNAFVFLVSTIHDIKRLCQRRGDN